MKAEIDQLDINKSVNVSTSLNNLKTKVNGSNVGFRLLRLENIKWCSR